MSGSFVVMIVDACVLELVYGFAVNVRRFCIVAIRNVSRCNYWVEKVSRKVEQYETSGKLVLTSRSREKDYTADTQIEEITKTKV